MARCPSCDYPLPDDRERVGARCPRCRDPLYEPVGRIPRPARPDEASCQVHADMESVGVCFRCGEQVCEVCRTRWRREIVCAACVDRALQTHEATPEQARTHRRQARLALLLGGGAWLPSILAFTSLQATGSQSPVPLTFLAFLILAGDMLVAALGAGQAVAALRTPGDYRARASVGLLLGGLHVGIGLGASTLFLWQNG
jgi:hypothetical protein